MSKVLIEKSTLNDIADVINEKSGQDKKYKAAEMAAEIEKFSLSAAGDKGARVAFITNRLGGEYDILDSSEHILATLSYTDHSTAICIPTNNLIGIKCASTPIGILDDNSKITFRTTFAPDQTLLFVAEIPEGHSILIIIG